MEAVQDAPIDDKVKKAKLSRLEESLKKMGGREAYQVRTQLVTVHVAYS